MHPTKLQRWSGLTRTVNDWDHGLRRDPELWYEEGDCYIHLHARGVSRRGPSFCIPYRVLRQKMCEAMIHHCHAQITSAPGSAPQRLKWMPSSLINANRQSSTVELFIPAPDAVSRQDSFNWHITTRNFFAFLMHKPLVGIHIGQAFVNLQERLHLYRPYHPSNTEDFLAYADHQGYRDLVECTDHALASLFYAEHYKLRDVWVDAFAHCVGMNASLILSPEFSLISKLTKALITRARREIDIHLVHVSTALRNFLQEDLSSTYLGLTDGARSHLDRFRLFLHAFYADKFGYWPPPRDTTFPKALYKSMYYDFKNLYGYLVDTDSSVDISSQRPASGGICVLQNVVTFDQRHKFNSQPHPLPLLPTYVPSPKRPDSHRPLRQLTLATQHNKTHQLHSMSGALKAATNKLDQYVLNSKIVQAYMHFEKVHAINSRQREEKITVTDARKVRWLLIYGTLQYLESVLRAPKQVRDSESPDYPLCYVADLTTPAVKRDDTTILPTPSFRLPQVINECLSESQSIPFSIEPDCRREDYFTPKNASRRGSMEVSALKITQVLRQSSVRSLKKISLSSRNSWGNSITEKPTQHRATTVYTDDASNDQCPTSIPSGLETSWLGSRTLSVSNRETSTSSTNTRLSTPLLECSQLDRATKPKLLVGTEETPIRSDSTSSTGSSLWSEGASVTSSKPSSCDDTHKASDAEESGLLGGLVPITKLIDSPRTRSLTSRIKPQLHVHCLLLQKPQQDRLHSEFDNEQSVAANNVYKYTDVPSTTPSPITHLSPDIKPTFTAVEERPLVSENRPLHLRSISTAPASASNLSTPKIGQDMVSSGSCWEQYTATLTQLRARSKHNTNLLLESAVASRSRISPTFKVPFTRFSKLSNEENRGVKSERRLSSLWKQ